MHHPRFLLAPWYFLQYHQHFSTPSTLVHSPPYPGWYTHTHHPCQPRQSATHVTHTSTLPTSLMLARIACHLSNSPTAFVAYQIFIINYCETPDFFFWLIFLLSSRPSLTTIRYPLHNSSMNTNLRKSSNFPKSFISKPTIVLSQV